MTRRRLALFAALSALACAPTAASAAVVAPHVIAGFAPCPGKDGVECASVGVPVDRSIPTVGTENVPGEISVRVERVKSKAPSAPPLIALTGGPGQSGSAFTSALVDALAPALKNRDLIVIDTRGTGDSGYVQCLKVGRARTDDETSAAIRLCYASLGARAPFYTSRDAAADIEDVRSLLLQVPQISLYGVSYGSKLAADYALLYPASTERIVLDSVVLPNGEDLYGRPSLGAVKRLIGTELCGKGQCVQATTDVLGDLTAVLRRISQAPISGPVFDGNGKSRVVAVDRGAIIGLFLAGDTVGVLRFEVPAALHAAATGDDALLLRLVGLLDSGGSESPAAKKEFSNGLFVADLCEESIAPWERGPGLDEAGRRAQAVANSSAIDPAVIAPFTPDYSLEIGQLKICSAWTTSIGAVSLYPAANPTAKAFVLSGNNDMRTPYEDALKVQGFFPNSEVFRVPGSGHSTITNENATCVQAAIGAFMTDQPRKPCADRRGLPVAPAPATSAAAAKPIAGLRGKTGVLASAVIETLHDAVRSGAFGLSNGSVSIGGLRGGSLNGTETQFRLKNYSFVRGFRVSGKVTNSPRLLALLRVRGSVNGELAIAQTGAFAARLNGKKIVGRVKVYGASPGPGKLLVRS